MPGVSLVLALEALNATTPLTAITLAASAMPTNGNFGMFFMETPNLKRPDSIPCTRRPLRQISFERLEIRTAPAARDRARGTDDMTKDKTLRLRRHCDQLKTSWPVTP